MKLKSYLIALRVWSLSASIIPTILGELDKAEVVQQVLVNRVFVQLLCYAFFFCSNLMDFVTRFVSMSQMFPTTMVLDLIFV